MSNSIDKFNNEVNPINSLSFLWQAEFIDGTIINQYDEDGTEHRFVEVMNKFNDLVLFSITNYKGHLFTINLKEGYISFNNTVSLGLIEPKNNIRLIYFRRVRGALTQYETQINTITHHIGMQWLDNENKNRKIVLQINQTGEFIIDGA